MRRNKMGKTWKSVMKHLPEPVRDKYIKTLGKVCGIESATEENLTEYFENSTKNINSVPVIYIGAGTCGLASGAEQTIDAIRTYLKEKGKEAELVSVGCIGYCAAEPIVDIKIPGKNRVSYSNITEDKVIDLLDNVFAGKFNLENTLGQFEGKNPINNVPHLNEHPFFKPQERNVLRNCGVVNPESIDEYISRGGYYSYLKIIHSKTGMEICKEILDSGLKGRGGGGFPTGIKWEIANKESSPVKYFICNADEGDPGAFMDRAVIEGDPHKLLEGLAIAAYAINAEVAYIYIRAEYPLAIERLNRAIEDAKKYGFIGKNIYDSGVSLEIKVKKGAGAFVCGEETALMHSIEGKRGMPRPRPPYPSVSGLFGKPTVINNVETLANVPEIIANGAEWFNSVGTENSKGTKVFALSGKVVNTGLIEVKMGTKIKDIIFDIGGGIPDGKAFKAVQIGGPSGGCLTKDHLELEIDYESLKSVGAMMGSGGLVVMDEDNCMVDVAKYFMEFIQNESCGKCIPCRQGTKRIRQILNSITTHRRTERKTDALERFKGIMQLENIAEVIKESSLCALGKSAANPVLSTLRFFRNEYETHIFERKCPTHTCKEMLTYSIDKDKCKGCMACIKKCPTGAIIGERKTPHYIIPNKCTGCGTCASVCKFNAIVIS
jgi:NADH:ubiquinone oxidoreductase subunit F (NADH-binding)/Pyruvate/2-oxoacid:ferredoxin oxidoreductase delta subunit/NADH:ubiquinone oxidoreductase subunit E